jgi:hypothetical protein
MKATIEVDQDLVIWIHLEGSDSEVHAIPPICLDTKAMRQDFPNAAFVNQEGFNRFADFARELS